MYESDRVRSELRALKATLNTEISGTILKKENQKKLRKYFHSLLKQERIDFRDIFLYKKESLLEDESMILDYADASEALLRLFELYIQENEPRKDEKIPLGTFYIAGTKYTADMADIFKNLHVDDSLHVSLEKNNPYDKNAIKISTKEGKKLGYLPKRLNYFPSYMLERKLTLHARLVKLRWSLQGYDVKVLLSCEV